MFEGYEDIMIFVISFLVGGLIVIFYEHIKSIEKIVEYRKMLFYLKKMNIEKEFKGIKVKLCWVHDKLHIFIHSKSSNEGVTLDILTLDEIYWWIVDTLSKSSMEDIEPEFDAKELKHLQTLREKELKKWLNEMAKKEEERWEANKDA